MIIEELIVATSSSKSLDNFIKIKFNSVLSFFEQDYNELKKYRWFIDDYIVENSSKIEELDFSVNHNSYTFVLFLQYLECFKLPQGFHVLYNLFKEKQIQLSLRFEASKIFLLEINKASDHFEKAPIILKILQNAYDNEEDSDKNVIVTFANFISNAHANISNSNNGIFNNLINYFFDSRYGIGFKR